MNTIPFDWRQLHKRLGTELASLDEAELEWLRVEVAAISRIQEQLNRLFITAGGAQLCQTCRGECCGCGRHHLTLTNLLGGLLAGIEPPEPDFSLTCPYLGATGCRLVPARRPYNCITFFCEPLEENLGAAGRARLRDLDGRLREHYQLIAGRYPLASLRGLCLALDRHGHDFLLRRQDVP
ncbi:MAG: hypothetical protein C0614_06840 [Desulfuromonas sp.]|nr:MAG: hypothetical protein C0614_06840 [Desulfuromonas sp.]